MTNIVISWSTNINKIGTLEKARLAFICSWNAFCDCTSYYTSSCGIFWLRRVFMAAIWGNILVNYLTYILGLTFQNLIFLFKKREPTHPRHLLGKQSISWIPQPWWVLGSRILTIIQIRLKTCIFKHKAQPRSIDCNQESFITSNQQKAKNKQQQKHTYTSQ